MKKLTALLLTLTLLLTSCNLNIKSDRSTVTFVDGETVTTAPTTLLGRIEYPTPEGRENFVFDGWYLDEELENRVPDDYKPEGDLTVYAGYSPDYQSLFASIYTDHIRSNVTVKVIVPRSDWFNADRVIGQGSGVIVYEGGGFYYCVTNYHVVAELGYSNLTFEITDCYGNGRSANIVHSDSASDLALLAFRKVGDKLRVAELAEREVTAGDRIISLGQPNGLINATTFGEVTKVDDVGDMEGSENTSYEYESIWHNAPIDHGSSGGGLFNDELKLVGINYAIAESADGDVTCSFAVTLRRLKEFLVASNILPEEEATP